MDHNWLALDLGGPKSVQSTPHSSTFALEPQLPWVLMDNNLREGEMLDG